ncbi:phenylethanolamine N-methyltransferase [Anguilla anguilla]|uniref:phenylethanolamine N-methyltransferase n=1 Tax=Anguilla anguilla TaxID=7936 RepID=UPI0015B33E7F|nr:phenylethanolamine N-methyltransferase [Anguilla anguilla]
MDGGRGEDMDQRSRDGVAAMARCYQDFDPKAYLQYNYTPPRADFTRSDSIVPWKLGCLHRAFTEGDVGGETLVDVGSGPTLYQVLSGCELFGRVVLTDFLEVNRRELRRWLRDEEGSFDWTPYLKHVCKLEGRGPTAWREKAARLRSVVTEILPIDVHRPSPLPPGSLPPPGADCLVSSFCLESVSPDLASFRRALGHLSALLKPGGHLLLIGALGESYYMAGPGVRIPVVPLDEAQVCSGLRDNGYALAHLSTYTLPPDMRVGVDDVSGIFFAKAKKMV